MKESLAKNNDFVEIKHSDHCKNVCRVALEMAKQSLCRIYDDILEAIRIASILHDVGKETDAFQNLLNGGAKEKKTLFRHNEVGWAFLHHHLNLPANIRSLVLYVVYWSHGISNKLNHYYSDEILNSIDDADITQMKEFVKCQLGEAYLLYNDVAEKSPLYFENKLSNQNDMQMLVKEFVVTADRIVSSLESQRMSSDDISKINLSDFFKNIVQNGLSDTQLLNINYSNYDKSRLEKQLQIANDTGKTTIIKAPGGYGKTLLAFLWAILNKKKILWVCPRNIIAEEVYRLLTIICKKLNLPIKIELYLTGEVKSKNYTDSDKKEFSADIVVTNIDNFLRTSIDNSSDYSIDTSNTTIREIDRLYFVSNCDVVFDEFPEFLSMGDSAMFACFINLMRIRNQFLSGRTLLLSATPSSINYLWDTLGCSTKILPNEKTHYPASHTKKYDMHVLEVQPYIPDNSSSFIIKNSTKNCQRQKNSSKSSLLIHNTFEPDAICKKMNEIHKTYGKNGNKKTNNPNTISTRLTETALDTSYRKGYESVFSPESTLQRLSRINRWGEFDRAPFSIFRDDSRSERATIEFLYNSNLSNMWFDFILKYNGCQMTLDEIYILYNEFYNKNKKAIESYINHRYRTSLNSLSKLYEIKNNKPRQKKSDIKFAGGNLLRNSGTEIFYICKKWNSRDFAGPFSIEIRRSVSADFNEQGNMLYAMFKSMKYLRDKNDMRFDYNFILNNKKSIRLDEIAKLAKKSNTPYIRYDVVYHPDYGVIDIDLLSEFN